MCKWSAPNMSKCTYRVRLQTPSVLPVAKVLTDYQWFRDRETLTISMWSTNGRAGGTGGKYGTFDAGEAFYLGIRSTDYLYPRAKQKLPGENPFPPPLLIYPADVTPHTRTSRRLPRFDHHHHHHHEPQSSDRRLLEQQLLHFPNNYNNGTKTGKPVLLFLHHFFNLHHHHQTHLHPPKKKPPTTPNPIPSH